jgi:mycothiol synthase
MPEQLQMIWPEGRPAPWPARPVPAGYRLREFRAGDEKPYVALMQAAGFDRWNRDNLDRVIQNAVPHGIVFAEHVASSRLAATAMAWPRPLPQAADAYEMGWVAADPAHRGLGLGELVTAAATRALLAHGARHIFLLTDDWRLPAIKGYLKLGYVPAGEAPEVRARWHELFRILNWPLA